MQRSGSDKKEGIGRSASAASRMYFSSEPPPGDLSSLLFRWDERDSPIGNDNTLYSQSLTGIGPEEV